MTHRIGRDVAFLQESLNRRWDVLAPFGIRLVQPGSTNLWLGTLLDSEISANDESRFGAKVPRPVQFES